MNERKQMWLDLIGSPTDYEFEHTLKLMKTWEENDYIIELYEQANGPGTTQRLMMLFPKNNITKPLPCVLTPFYFPEAMLGYDPESGAAEEQFIEVAMMLHLVRRGYAAASADSYHLTYIRTDRERDDFARWQEAAEALNSDHPNWSGVGKLVHDTRLIIDAMAADPRVDETRIGIAGHSLGGKMAFYTGCLDERIKVILASDFGIGWDQTNWRDIWYWGSQVEDLIAAGMDHAQLLGIAAPKPFCLMAGEFDDASSYDLMCRAPGYAPGDERLGFIHYATGHRPPQTALESGYDFLDRWLKNE